MLFQNGKLSVRILEKEDAHLLAKWLCDPGVLEFYEGRDNPFDLDRVEREFYNPDEDGVLCIVEFDGVPAGYIQFYHVTVEDRMRFGYEDPSEVIYGMDQFIGETELWNKGVGTILVQGMVKYLKDMRRADRVVMDPQTWNLRALRCYEKCGFKKVMLLPKNELHEGEYRDCWLVEYKC
ncbi:GNAT family N-acetyltransferase [Fictibacillus aquaticus]|uniref:GNAT family N-acetyltransferase n=1 Tax=Fictibacillus aquaticus TaxID=2021314 RepID=A0A235F7K4_9BACL|nr:GNAT family N-acetyltransferase [Fictibacillus aquaticus]OYD56675.1 GNAT family N-acetyltransferase [Fictibacillus aquaticus]